MNLYSILGLDRGPPAPAPGDVKRAYRAAARKAHPDHGGTSEKFAAIVLARDVLLDGKRREKYDNTGEIDPKTVDQTETDALQKVIAAIDVVIATIEQRSRSVEEFDVVGDATILLKKDLTALEARKRSSEKQAAKLRKLAKRFHGEPNRIAPMFEARAAEMERNIAASEPAFASQRRAIEILAAHSFEVDRKSDWY